MEMTGWTVTDKEKENDLIGFWRKSSGLGSVMKYFVQSYESYHLCGICAHT
jgi:hypothetical protein